jgi:hypothetical protein
MLLCIVVHRRTHLHPIPLYLPHSLAQKPHSTPQEIHLLDEKSSLDEPLRTVNELPFNLNDRDWVKEPPELSGDEEMVKS